MKKIRRYLLLLKALILRILPFPSGGAIHTYVPVSVISNYVRGIQKGMRTSSTGQLVKASCSFELLPSPAILLFIWRNSSEFLVIGGQCVDPRALVVTGLVPPA